METNTPEKPTRLVRSHKRSLQREIHAILDKASRLAPDESGDELNLVIVNTGGTSTWSRVEIYGRGGR